MGKLLEELLPQEEVEEIINLYQNNVSLRDIEKQTHHGRQAVSKMLERLGVKTTSGNHYRKYFFDFDFFEKIDTELKAYWLGFLYADGCILPVNKYGEQDFQLTLGIQDEEILQKYKEDLKSTYPIRYDTSRHDKNPNHQIQVICKYRSQKTVNDLKKLGCVEQKSLILNFPTEQQVPKELVRHFIRGYFDGDGSVTHYKNAYHINFVGTENFIKELATHFQGGTVFPDKRKTNSWYFSLGGNQQVLNAYEYMYKDATRYMQRKYDKFQPLTQKYSENQGIKI